MRRTSIQHRPQPPDRLRVEVRPEKPPVPRLAQRDHAELRDEALRRGLSSESLLNLWVKVKRGWSDDERALKSLGYDLD